MKTGGGVFGDENGDEGLERAKVEGPNESGVWIKQGFPSSFSADCLRQPEFAVGRLAHFFLALLLTQGRYFIAKAATTLL